METNYDTHLIPPYATLESTNLFKRWGVQLAHRLVKRADLVSRAALALGVSLLAAACFKPIRGSLAVPLLGATGFLLGGIALAIMTGKKVLERAKDAEWKCANLQTQKNFAEALSLSRYWRAFLTDMGLDSEARFYSFKLEGNTVSKGLSKTLLEEGRRLYLFDNNDYTVLEAQMLFSQLTTHNYSTLAEAKKNIPKKSEPQFQGDPKRQLELRLPLFRKLGFFDTTYPSFKKYDALIIYDQPEFRAELKQYIIDIWKSGIRFERIYLTTTVKDFPDYVLPSEIGIEIKNLNKAELKDHTCLVVTGAPFVPNTDRKLRAQKPQLKFETVGPHPTAHVPFEAYVKEIWKYVKNRPLPKENI